MSFKLYTLLLFFLVKISISQELDDPVHFTNFNKAYLEHLVKIKIDSVRDENSCKNLINDSILYMASNHHAQYMLKNSRLTHYETDSKTETPQLRAEEFGARHYSVGENVLKTKYNSIITTKKGKRINTATYSGLADAIVTGWCNSPGHFKNIITPEYQLTAVSIFINKEKKQVYACQKFATIKYRYAFYESKELFPYSTYIQKPIISNFNNSEDSLLIHDHQWNLNHDQLNECTNCEMIMQNKPVISLRYENGNFILKIENSSFVKQLLQNKTDGFAIEIVQFEDYVCGNPEYYTKSSRRNKECRLNGKVLQPLYREELYKGYKKRKKKEDFSFLSYIFNADSVPFFDRFYRYKIEKYSSEYFEIKLGKLPKDITGLWNHNLIYIQNNQICHVDYFTKYCGEPYEYYKGTEMFFPDRDTSYSFQVQKKELFLTIPFEKNETKIGEEILIRINDSLNAVKYSIDSVAIHAFSSVEGDSSKNAKLQQQRAQAIIEILNQHQIQPFNSNIQVSSDWEHFLQNIKKSPKWKFLSTYDKEQLQELINTKYADSLEYILKKERRTNVVIQYSIDIVDENLAYYTINEQELLLDSLNNIKDQESELFSQTLATYQQFYGFVHHCIINGKLDTSIIKDLKMPNGFAMNTKLTEQYLLNGHQFNRYFAGNNTWKKDENELVPILIEKNFTMLTSEFIYDYCKLSIDQMITSNNFSKKDIEDKFNLLKEVYNSRPINEELGENIYTLIHNLNVLLINNTFYNDPLMYSEEAQNCIRHLINIYSQPTFLWSDSTALELAKTAVYYNNINLAIEILTPHATNENVLAYLLPLYYQHNAFDTKNEFYNELISSSTKMNDNSWCNLFLNNCGIPFQAFDNEKVKNIFCAKCLDKNIYMKEILK